MSDYVRRDHSRMTSMIMPANRNAAVIIDNLQRDHEFVIIASVLQHTQKSVLMFCKLMYTLSKTITDTTTFNPSSHDAVHKETYYIDYRLQSVVLCYGFLSIYVIYVA